MYSNSRTDAQYCTTVPVPGTVPVLGTQGELFEQFSQLAAQLQLLRSYFYLSIIL